MVLSKETLDRLTAEFKNPQDLQSAYSQMLQHMINRALEGEMQAHLGHERNGRSSGNTRKRQGTNVKKDKDTHFFITTRDWAPAISLHHALSLRHEFGKACQGRGQRHVGIFRIVGVPFSPGGPDPRNPPRLGAPADQDQKRLRLKLQIAVFLREIRGDTSGLGPPYANHPS